MNKTDLEKHELNNINTMSCFTTENIRTVFEKWGCKLHSDYVNSKTKMEWTCKCGKDFFTTIRAHSKSIRDPTIRLCCKWCKRSEKKVLVTLNCKECGVEKTMECISSSRKVTYLCDDCHAKKESAKIARKKKIDSNRVKKEMEKEKREEEKQAIRDKLNEDVASALALRGCEMLGKYVNAATPFEWKCRCGKIVKSALHNKFSMLKDSTVTWGCKSCNSGKRNEKSIVIKMFEASGCKLLDEYTSTKTKVRWICACGSEQVSQFGSKLRQYRENGKLIMCRSCAITKSVSNNKDYYSDMKEILEKEGWRMLSEKPVRMNAKTLVEVETPDGLVKTTTWTRWVANEARSTKTVKQAAEERSITIAQARLVFDSKGNELLAEKFKDRYASMEYICGECGDHSHSSYASMRRNKNGWCRKCRLNSVKANWEIIEDTFESAGCSLATSEKNYVNNTTPLEYICWCGGMGFRSWKQFALSPGCNNCADLRRRKTNLEMYGYENYFEGEEGKARIRKYYQEHFGVDHNMKLERCRRKARETSIKNNGVPYVFATPRVWEKARLAHIKKWGGPPGTVEEIRERQKQTCLERFGVEFPLQSKEIHDKIKKTNLDRYGNIVFLASDAGKELMVEKYGFENAMQCSEFFDKAMKSAFRYKEFIFPSGRVDQVQGYEHHALAKLLSDGVPEDEIITDVSEMPVIKYTFGGKNRRYYPDIYVPSLNLVIEVKSQYTLTAEYDKNIAKWVASAKMLDIVVQVYDGRGRLCEEFNNSDLI